MNLDWVKDNIIYVTKAGSQSYGTANELSDLDVKGIVIPPREIEYHLYNRVEQVENSPLVEAMAERYRNHLNPKIESTVYTLKKFFVLASEVNPNIIELLYTDPSDHIVTSPILHELMENRDLFLSNKARYTFSGYAVAQAKKIERHRKWIILGEVKPPVRADFGLPDVTPKGVEEIFGHIKSKVEQWNLNQYPLDEMSRAELKDTIWELVSTLTEKEYSVANWPDKYAEGIIFKMQKEWNLKDEVVVLINAERAYAKAKQVYDSWVSWKKERNPARRELEVKCGYDSKHASHLVRLMRMGHEILSTGKVIVKRPDAAELLEIKNGAWTYEKVMEYKEEIESKLEAEYIRQKQLIAEGKPTPLPRENDKEKLNNLYHKLFEKYWGEQLCSECNEPFNYGCCGGHGSPSNRQDIIATHYYDGMPKWNGI